jgi:thiol-disulfide isomerase/thioredoxin
MKNFLALLFLSLTFNFTFAQNTPVPDHVASQNFPDSVLNLSLSAHDNQKITFAQILEKHKGKKIVIDVWASWCRDCIEGYPKLDELRQKSDSAHVAFVFISVDKDETKWRAAIERFHITGEHYRSETAWYNTFTNYIVLDWIPRYVVIDEQSKVVLPKAISAETKEMKALVD